MNSDPVILERYGRRAELVLNRPDNKNAVTGPLVQLLCKYLMDLSEDPDVGAIIIRGADGCFCAGLDLKQFSAAGCSVNGKPEKRVKTSKYI